MNIALLISSLFVLTSAEINSDGLDSLLLSQRVRAGDFAAELFYSLDGQEELGLNREEITDLRFLLAYLPLADLAMMDGVSLLENVKLAREAQSRFAWGEKTPDLLYRHFILPHRISQEPFRQDWRGQFLAELTPRLQGMSMEEAALEVNHWCHEVATFKQSSGRDQDPLTTIRAGLGRCEEEMILTIAALRSVGIPARQCYTPYWPHTDNNHAWVEVWVDGQWYYYGACEPKPQLRDAWFTLSAGRAMLVVSTAYGDYQGNEPVLKKYDRSTLINSTAVYGETRELEIKLVDHKGRPIKDQRVIFSLFNYGAFMPALGLNTDDGGICNVTCGKGDWIISAGKDKYSAILHSDSSSNSVLLQLEKNKKLKRPTAVDYQPPPPLPPIDKPPKDSLFQCRIERENEIRERHFWQVWSEEAGVNIPDNALIQPDSVIVSQITSQTDIKADSLLSILEKSRGNWGHLYKFLSGSYPVVGRPFAYQSECKYTPEEVEGRYLLLETLKEKDLRDFILEALDDHYRYTTLKLQLAAAGAVYEITGWEADVLERYKDYVIAPRIGWEPSAGWRQSMNVFFNERPELLSSKKDKKLIKWLRKNLTIEEKPDRLGPTLPPNKTLKLRRGRQGDVAILYIALSRVRGIPARFNPVTGNLERWEDDRWVDVILFPDEKKSQKPGKNGKLTITIDEADSTLRKAKYLQKWAVQKWVTDHWDAVDFGYQKPFSEISFPQELPVGLYCLTTGIRREDGSAPVKVTWFEIKKSKELNIELDFRNP